MAGVANLDTVVAREAVLRVDFELLDDDGCLWISMRFRRQSSPADPRPGDVVYLLDGKGCGCVGRVGEVQGWYVCVRPDWETWTGDSPPPRPTRPAPGRAPGRGRRAR